MTWKIRGMTNQKIVLSRPGSEKSYTSRVTEDVADVNISDQEIILNQDELKKLSPAIADGNRVSFLTVPTSPDLRRPSTADVVIEKLQVEKMEGGGMSISGVAIVANCHLTLIIFGVFFLLAGLVLSYIGFGTGGKGDFPSPQAAGAPKGTFEKPDSHYQMQIIGPIFLVVGLLMLLVGISMFGIHYKVSKDDKKKRLARSAVQIHQLENNFNQAQNINASPIHTVIPSPHYSHPILSLRRGSWWMEPTPIEEPQTPSSLNPTEYNQTSRRGSRSPSPSLERNILTIDWPAYKQQEINPRLMDSMSGYSYTMGQHTPSLDESLKKSSVTSYTSYSANNGDIATFPGEDLDTVASFPVVIHPPDKEKPLFSSRIVSPNPSVFSLRESEAATGTPRKEGIGSASSFASATCDPQFSPSNETCVEFERSNSDEEYSPRSASVESRQQIIVPKIQIGTSMTHRVIPSFENSKRLMIAEGSSTRNLPLSKNGIALPRLSRHSVSSRPPETISSTRPDTSYSARPETHGSSQDAPYPAQDSTPN